MKKSTKESAKDAEKKSNRIKVGGAHVSEFVSSSGSLILDSFLSRGGFPSGSLVQYMSKKEGSFKTAASLSGLAEIQRLGYPVGFIDAELSCSEDWAKAIGVDTSTWFYGDPLSGEEAFEMAEEMIKTHGVRGLIIDSIDACRPSVEYSNEYGDQIIGTHAKLVTKAVRRLSSLAAEHDTTIFLVNQMRTNFTQQGPMGDKQSGGDAINFYCKINIRMDRPSSSELRSKEEDKESSSVVDLKLRIERSKLGRSFVELNTVAIQGRSISQEHELVSIALRKKMLVQAGSWIKTTDGNSIGQGKYSGLVLDWAIENKQKIITHISHE